MKSNHKRRGLAWYEKPIPQHGGAIPEHVERSAKGAVRGYGEPGSRRERESMRQRHRKWPMGTRVLVHVTTAQGNVDREGTIACHVKGWHGKAWVDFGEAFAIYGDPYERISHPIAFARMHRLTNHYTE